jgi:hypothetical protein
MTNERAINYLRSIGIDNLIPRGYAVDRKQIEKGGEG